MDELPQIINIFLGHMSFAGPRPERPELVAEIVERLPEFRRREQIRPGLTGLAQVYGRYYTEPEQKLPYDLDYVAAPQPAARRAPLPPLLADHLKGELGQRSRSSGEVRIARSGRRRRGGRPGRVRVRS